MKENSDMLDAHLPKKLQIPPFPSSQSCDWEFNCSSRNIWTISGGYQKWGSPQIIPKLNHVRKFSLETSIETDGFGDPFQEPPIFRYLSRWQPPFAHGSRFGDVCHVGAYDPAGARLHHDPVHPYDDHCLVACNHEADSSSKIVMSVISGSNT